LVFQKHHRNTFSFPSAIMLTKLVKVRGMPPRSSHVTRRAAPALASRRSAYRGLPDGTAAPPAHARLRAPRPCWTMSSTRRRSPRSSTAGPRATWYVRAWARARSVRRWLPGLSGAALGRRAAAALCPLGREPLARLRWRCTRQAYCTRLPDEDLSHRIPLHAIPPPPVQPERGRRVLQVHRAVLVDCQCN
jgi:hypothetical protein